MNEWVRYIGMVDSLAAFACVMWVDARTEGDVHKAVTWTLRFLLAFPVAIFFGLLSNITTGTPVTAGAYVVALLLTPIACALLVVALRFRGVDNRLAQFIQVTSELECAPPCETPECIKARRDLRDIRDGKRQ